MSRHGADRESMTRRRRRKRRAQKRKDDRRRALAKPVTSRTLNYNDSSRGVLASMRLQVAAKFSCCARAAHARFTLASAEWLAAPLISGNEFQGVPSGFSHAVLQSVRRSNLVTLLFDSIAAHLALLSAQRVWTSDVALCRSAAASVVY